MDWLKTDRFEGRKPKNSVKLRIIEGTQPFKLVINALMSYDDGDMFTGCNPHD